MSNEVKLYVYQHSNADSTSKMPKWYCWDVSVFVFETEIFYDENGIIIKEYGGRPTEMIHMGDALSDKNKQQILKHVDTLEYTWSKDSYHYLNCNSVHFAEEILNFLGIDEIIPLKYTEKCSKCAPPSVTTNGAVVKHKSDGFVGFVGDVLGGFFSSSSSGKNNNK